MIDNKYELKSLLGIGGSSKVFSAVSNIGKHLTKSELSISFEFTSVESS